MGDIYDFDPQWTKEPKVGDIIHFQSSNHRTRGVGKAGFVRCTVVRVLLGSPIELRATGLVGHWPSDTLPGYDKYGEVDPGDGGRYFQDGGAKLSPLPIFMWEACPAMRELFPDVPSWPEIDVSTPDHVPPDIAANVPAWRAIAAIAQVCQEAFEDDTIDPHKMVGKVRQIATLE
jgi:hypothetical protein